MSAEPLAETAPVTRLLAQAACRGGCEPYHGLHSYDRLLREGLEPRVRVEVARLVERTLATVGAIHA